MKINDPVKEYAQGVIKGKYPAGYLVKAACVRHLDDLKRSRRKTFRYRFNLKKAMRAIRFCGLMKHYKGPFKGKPFEPLPWQMFVLGCIFGWVQKGTGLRRFKASYVEIPRKNGKTYLAAAVGLFMLVADGEGGPEVYAGATKKEQAKIVWDDAWAIIKHSPSLRKHLQQKYSTIVFDANDGKFLPLSADARTLDGLNPHCGLIDEYHEHPDSSVYDVLEDGMGARSQPVMFTITTAGNNMNSACYELHTHCENILTNDGYDDDRTFCYIACPDKEDYKGDAWTTPEVWYKANPSLGSAKREDYMQAQVDQAKLRPSREHNVKNKQLDMWTATEKKWLDMSRWDECGGEIDLEKLRGERCYVGLDLSGKYDFTCAGFVFPPGPYPEWVLWPRFYYPEENLREREREMRVPLTQWAKEGLITLTPGDMIDMDFIYEDMLKLSAIYDIVEVGFDPWRAVEIATRLENEGFDMVQMRQGHATLGAPTSELETKMMKGQLRHGGNPILRWMAGNTMTREDPNGNIVPDKKKSAQKIDGIVAEIMGLGRAIVGVGDGTSIYDEHGIRTV